jgi:2-amino-4-deoxychorismate synthase
MLDEIPRSPVCTIALVPFCQIRERGFEVHDSGEPILALVVDELTELPGPAPSEVTDRPITVSPVVYDPDDAGFAQTVQNVIDEEIERGEGSNFLLSRTARTEIADYGPWVAKTVFHRLIRKEPNAYLTFCFSDGETYWVGASPERNVSIRDGEITMNPICGTLAKNGHIGVDELLAFVNDPKEMNELFQVVDEELKMMARLCPLGGRVLGPFLKEMGSVIHTEYMLKGQTDQAPLEAFRYSMFAPTMVGSPLENAARVITRHERDSRRYYSSAIMILEGEGEDARLDSAITIRTMELQPDGTAVVHAGASIVRDSSPLDEVSEVKAKANAMLGALSAAHPTPNVLSKHATPPVLEALQERNRTLSEFWMSKQPNVAVAPSGMRIVLIDHEDDFTRMLAHLFRRGGHETVIRSHTKHVPLDSADLFVLGPGPGDPTATNVRKIATLHERVATYLEHEIPFIAVCLSHQVLCHTLGMHITRLDPPLQGVQKVVDLYGRPEPVGFYNTFMPDAPSRPPDNVEISVHEDHAIAVKGPHFVSYQFHVESILTTAGSRILDEGVAHVTRQPTSRETAV